MEGSPAIPNLPEKLGINILSAGPDNVTQKDYDYFMSLFQSPGWDLIRDYMIPAPWQWTVYKVLAKLAEVDVANDFDIIVSELSTLPVGTYLARKGNQVVILSSLLPLMTDASMPNWPSPLVGLATCTDDMTFLDRLINCLLGYCQTFFSFSIRR